MPSSNLYGRPGGAPSPSLDRSSARLESDQRQRARDSGLSVGVRTFPYLADHGFQDMVVVPGSFYIDLALSVHRDRFGRASATVRNAKFLSPVILSSDDTHITVDVTDRGTFVEYVFYEHVAAALGSGAQPRSAAQLEVHPLTTGSDGSRSESWSVESFQATAQVVLDGKQFYKTLRANGNRYGPQFQQLTSIWRDRDRALARTTVPPRETENDARACRPLLLDAATQLTSVFTVEQGQTFILRSIDRIDVPDLPYPDRLWTRATWVPDSGADSSGSVGHVRMVDGAGRTYLELSGVRLTFLPRGEAAARRTPPRLCVAATFTAEPLADSLNFWADQFDTTIDLTFSPYNQTFQQLLHPASAFHQNADGANVILLALEDWTGRRVPAMRVSEERAQQCFGDRARHVLPNGLEIVHLNQYETDYVYQEIFEDRCYVRHGVQLRDDATVVDIGANIGLFSLFVRSRCARPRILAFEPSPVVYDLLRANCEAYAPDVRVFNLGVAATIGTATLTFYEKSSLFSGFHADLDEDRAAIRAVVRNQLSGLASVAPGEIDRYVSELAADRLRAKTYACRTTSVSEIIRAHDLATIDLLKIDAEKSELDILAGIHDDDWARIQQIVIEVHDRSREKVGQVERLLTARGYSCVVDQEPGLAQSGLFNVFATRAGRVRNEALAASLSQEPRHASDLERHVDDFCDALRSFMRQPRVPLILAFCPASAASRTDPALTAALGAAEERLATEVTGIAQLHTIRSASWAGRYHFDHCADPQSDQLGHIPYTSEGYAAIGTSLFRLMFNLQQEPYKVIVLDCDNTLWKGVCGEDGPLGVEVTPPYRALQEFMVEQAGAGRLLCLCSKNNESDVVDVFQQRTDMVLREEHLVSRRVNWSSKSENLQSLASELNLGLESFIFVDDNPVECRDVEINCPGVLTLQLPKNADDIPAFLDHIWAFDSARSTNADRNRTRLYQQNIARERSRTHMSLNDFIKGLGLSVAVAEPAATDLDRVSQLTFRTNQFNFTTIRRSEIEVRDFLARDHAAGLVVRVSDRFGEYGLVGVVLFEIDADRYRVDTFLLSCRVLGKGVEHAIVAALARRAVADGKSLVEFRFAATAKNAPAFDFLRGLAHLRRDASAGSWVFAAEDLVHLEYHPADAPIGPPLSRAGSADQVVPPPSTFRRAGLSARMQRLGTDLCRIGGIANAIEEHRLRVLPARSASVAASSALETALGNIWQRVLGVSRLGVNDNFFEAGGTSLNAVQVIATIKKELKYDMSIVHLFECPTVSLLAARFRSVSEPAPGDTAPAGAALRGQQRRERAIRRKTF
jgi:FkbH-like protein/FkbM family methyltransferase